jgi:hypothetical protein
MHGKWIAGKYRLAIKIEARRLFIDPRYRKLR